MALIGRFGGLLVGAGLCACSSGCLFWGLGDGGDEDGRDKDPEVEIDVCEVEFGAFDSEIYVDGQTMALDAVKGSLRFEVDEVASGGTDGDEVVCAPRGAFVLASTAYCGIRLDFGGPPGLERSYPVTQAQLSIDPECTDIDAPPGLYEADDLSRLSVKVLEEPGAYECRLAEVELYLSGSFSLPSGASVELDTTRVRFEGYFPSRYASDCE